MSSGLIHIYGPFSVQVFGLAIVVGLLVFTWFAQRHPLRKKLISYDEFINVIIVGALTGIAGARLLFLIKNWNSLDSVWEAFAIWEGGFSILGGIIAIMIVLPIYLKKNNTPTLPFLDLIGLHTPLLQGIARVGCFFAGCCYGKPTTLPWAVTYTAPTIAGTPLCTPLHPTQLYLSGFYLLIFLFMYFYVQKKTTKPGQMIMIYLMFASAQRFFIDFLRGDREFITPTKIKFFSLHQWIALCMFTAACAGFYYVSRTKKVQH